MCHSPQIWGKVAPVQILFTNTPACILKRVPGSLPVKTTRQNHTGQNHHAHRFHTVCVTLGRRHDWRIRRFAYGFQWAHCRDQRYRLSPVALGFGRGRRTLRALVHRGITSGIANLVADVWGVACADCIRQFARDGDCGRPCWVRLCNGQRVHLGAWCLRVVAIFRAILGSDMYIHGCGCALRLCHAPCSVRAS